jgi:hypothetical protein
MKMDINSLSPEQLADLKNQIAQAEQQKEQAKEGDRKVLKKMASEAVENMFTVLDDVSSTLTDVKDTIFKNFKSILVMKKDMYGTKEEQRSHTFSNEANTKRITLGYRVIDRYDDSVNEGIEMVNTCINSLVKDERSQLLLDMVNLALKKNKEGTLSASRVLDLHKISTSDTVENLTDFDIERFREGIRVIMDAYRPERSAYYIEASYRLESGVWENVALSMSSAEYPRRKKVR